MSDQDVQTQGLNAIRLDLREGQLVEGSKSDEPVISEEVEVRGVHEDDLEGALDDVIQPVPGADKQHHPAHAMSKGETKHLGL